MTRDGTCVPGVYAGDFLGLAGAPVPFVPVTGLSLEGGPPLELELRPSGGGEFVYVGDGSLSGSANGLFNFEAEIHGTLDCETKKFSGTLTGSATDVFGVFLNQEFTGNMTADYDGASHAFVNGKWDLMSRDANAQDGGLTLAPSDVTGNGDWNGVMDGGVAHDAGSDASP